MCPEPDQKPQEPAGGQQALLGILSLGSRHCIMPHCELCGRVSEQLQALKACKVQLCPLCYQQVMDLVGTFNPDQVGIPQPPPEGVLPT